MTAAIEFQRRAMSVLTRLILVWRRALLSHFSKLDALLILGTLLLTLLVRLNAAAVSAGLIDTSNGQNYYWVLLILGIIVQLIGASLGNKNFWIAFLAWTAISFSLFGSINPFCAIVTIVYWVWLSH